MDPDEVIKYLELDRDSPDDKPIGLHGHITGSAIALYAEGQSPDFEVEIQNHLATCTTCQEELEALRKALAHDKAHPERLNALVERISALLEGSKSTKH